MVVSSESAEKYRVGTFIEMAMIKAAVVLPAPGAPANMHSWPLPNLTPCFASSGSGSGNGVAILDTATLPNGTGI